MRRRPLARRSTCWRPSSRSYVLFLYGPMIVIFVLSFQGPKAA